MHLAPGRLVPDRVSRALRRGRAGALIRLDGTDVDFLHLLGGIDLADLDKVREIVHNGMQLKAVWKDERIGHILDLKHFAPV